MSSTCNCSISEVPESPRLLPIPEFDERNGPVFEVPLNLRWAGDMPQAAEDAPRPLHLSKKKFLDFMRAAPPPFLGFPVPRVATAHFLTQQTTAQGRAQHLPTSCSKGLAVQRHVAGARASSLRSRRGSAAARGLGGPAAAAS